MLKLRRGVVVGEDPLTVEIGGEARPAWADHGLVGEVREGDDRNVGDRDYVRVNFLVEADALEAELVAALGLQRWERR